MKKFSFYALFLLYAFQPVKSQLISYNLQQTFTAAQLDGFLSGTGFSLPVAPQYNIAVYQVLYKTPYKHIDSLVTASGIVVVPTNSTCPSALGCYAHGTFARRTEVPSYDGPERPIGFFFAGIGGVVTAMPDELGMGDSDPSIPIHPYINAFHSGYASVNIMRAARQLADTLGISLSGEVALTGYSQGGYTTMATNKLIQENFANEFNIVASAPMSGPYDLKKTMVDVMLSTAPFSSPSYLPYLLLGHHSVSAQLRQAFPTPSHIFKSPYDTVIPPLFYSKQYSTGQIDQYCDQVPRNMILDSVITAFQNDTLHPFRLVLNENDLMGWAPRNPVKIHYCTADEQVNYLNAVRADSAWRNNGAPDIQIQNFGPFSHGGCVEPAITSAALYILGRLSACTGIQQQTEISFSLVPNPSRGTIRIITEEGEHTLKVYTALGQLIHQQQIAQNTEVINLSKLYPGVYLVEVGNATARAVRKLIIE